MIHDFYMLEHYYGPQNAVQDLGETIKRYGIGIIKEAIQNGDVHVMPKAHCGWQSSSLIWLSEAGREKAAFKARSIKPSVIPSVLPAEALAKAEAEGSYHQ